MLMTLLYFSVGGKPADEAARQRYKSTINTATVARDGADNNSMGT